MIQSCPEPASIFRRVGGMRTATKLFLPVFLKETLNSVAVHILDIPGETYEKTNRIPNRNRLLDRVRCFRLRRYRR